MTIDETIVTNALKAHRDGDIFQLADSPLAQTALINGYFLPDEPRTTLQLGQAVQTVLRWVVDGVRPMGEQDWLSPLWRTFNVLDGFYFQRDLIATLAERMAIADQTFYDWRNSAVATITRLLQSELDDATATTARRQFALMTRYDAQPATLQAVIQLLALLESDETLPIDWLPLLLDNVPNLATPLIVSERRTVRLHKDLARVIQPKISPPDWRHLHNELGKLFHAALQPFSALVHWSQGGRLVAAAEQIVTHQDSFLAEGLAEAVQRVILGMGAADFADHPTLWAQLQLVAGRIAEQLNSLEVASAAYAQALAAPDLPTKATAYHRRAKLMQRINLDECLIHYNMGFDLLADADTPALQTLRVRMYIDRAWIYIQERPDWEAATLDLISAESHLPAHDVRLRCDLYNALAGLAMRRGNAIASIQNRQKAWVTAAESGDQSLMLKTAYNLGQGYYRNQQFVDGEPYLQRSLALAEEINDQQMIAMTHKGMGNGAFLQGDYQQALTHYQHAYAVWQETGNHNWLAGVCYDLTETHIMLNQLPAARPFYEQGIALVTTLQHERLGDEFAELQDRFPSLTLQLNERQERAVQFIRANGAITRRQYVALSELSQTQAYRDIEELLSLGVLERVGSGRGTRYVLTSQQMSSVSSLPNR